MPIFLLLTLVIAIVTIIDVAKAPENEVRHLPKPFWLVIVILAPFLGAIGWFLAGRPDSVSWSNSSHRPSAFPEYERPGRQSATEPVGDEEFLRQCRERAEEQRRKHREDERRRETERE